MSLSRSFSDSFAMGERSAIGLIFFRFVCGFTRYVSGYNLARFPDVPVSCTVYRTLYGVSEISQYYVGPRCCKWFVSGILSGRALYFSLCLLYFLSLCYT